MWILRHIFATSVGAGVNADPRGIGIGVSVEETADCHHVNVNIDPSSKRKLRPSYVKTPKPH
jgi:hypothetical protein